MKRNLLTLFFMLFVSNCFGDIIEYTQPGLQFTELDGSPDTYPYQVLVPNGTMVQTGGIIELQYGEGSGGGGSGHTIQDEGVNLSARTYLNFAGAGVTATDDAGNNATLVTIAGGGGVSDVTATSPLASSGGATPDISISTTPSFTNVTATDTATSPVVDTQYIEYGGGSTVTVRDNLTVNGTVASTTITGANVTSGSNPGHTHTSTSITEADPIYSANSYATSMNQNVATTSSPTFATVTATDTATGNVVDTQILENTAGGVVSVRDGITTTGDVTITDTSTTALKVQNAASSNQFIVDTSTGAMSFSPFQQGAVLYTATDAPRTFSSSSQFGFDSSRLTTPLLTVSNSLGMYSDAYAPYGSSNLNFSATTDAIFDIGGAIRGQTNNVDDLGTSSVNFKNLYLAGTATGSVVCLKGSTYNTYFDPGAATSTVYYKIPPNAGTSGYQLTTDGVGNLSWDAAGATAQLDNLSSVAINTSLLPASTNSIDLGSSSKQFKDIYLAGTATSPVVDTQYLEYSSGGNLTVRDGLTINGSSLLVDSNTVNLSDTTDENVLAFDTTTQTWRGVTPTAGGGANTALSNLASVAINESLISDTNNTDDLGSSANKWKDIYSAGTATGSVVDTQYLEYSGGGALTVRDNLTINGNVEATNVSSPKTVQFTIPSPDLLDEQDYLVVWNNASTRTFNITSINAWSDKIVSVILWKATNTGASRTQICDLSVATAGTNLFYGSTSVASSSVVDTTNILQYDYVSGTPNHIKITINGNYQ